MVHVEPGTLTEAPTFQHLDCYGHGLLGLLLVNAQGLGHHHLAKAALPQGLAQGQPGDGGEGGKRGEKEEL